MYNHRLGGRKAVPTNERKKKKAIAAAKAKPTF
jgi:hypothetical protein